MPTTEHGKAIASRNATTHGVFARDIVLPALGEDPDGYRQVQDELVAQLRPGNLLERHYIEKIAAASWRLRRLHRWQAQLFEDDTLTEDERLDKLDKVLRHETALHRQIDTAVKMLAKDVPHLYTQRAREQVLADTRTAAREYQDNPEDAVQVDLQLQDYLYRIRKANTQALDELSVAPLDTGESSVADAGKSCPSPSGDFIGVGGVGEGSLGAEPQLAADQICQNEPAPILSGSLSFPKERAGGEVSPFPLREGSALAPGVGTSGVGTPGVGILRKPAHDPAISGILSQA